MVQNKSQRVISPRAAFTALSVLAFFFSAQVSLTIYVNSSFLVETIIQTPSMGFISNCINDEDSIVGLIYALASLVTLLALFFAPRILRKVGNYKWTLFVIVFYILLLLLLAYLKSAWLIIPVFIIAEAITSILYFNIDIFLERYSEDSQTGRIRGLFLMIGSIAWLLPPVLAGGMIDSLGFSAVYMLAALLIVPTIFIVIRYFRAFEDLLYEDATFFMTKAQSKAHPDVRNILWTNFFMHFFYAIMVIYAPRYLHDSAGFSYQEIGFILTCALSAFIIFPYPTGRIADKYIGEKELLIVGFSLMAVTSATLPYLVGGDVSLFMWIAILFFGRMGAATVETMTESYFFKKIDGHDAGLISHFRRSRPLAFIAAPILASLLLAFNFVSISGIFLVLAGIMLIAIYFPLQLVDTK